MLLKETEFLANKIQVGSTQHCFDKCDFLKKEASAESIKYFNGLKPKKNHLYFLVVAMTAGEFWSCFTKGNTFISADGGIKDISEVTSGDRVVSHNGNINKVNVPISKEVTGDFVKISARCIPETESTAAHEYRVVRRKQIQCKRDKYKRCTSSTMQNSNICFRGKGCDVFDFNPTHEWVEGKDIKKGDFLIIPRRRATKYDGKTVDQLHIDYAKLIGYFLAEGSFVKDPKKRKTALELSFHQDEVLYRKELSDIAERFGVNSFITKPKRGSKEQGVIISSRTLSDFIYSLCGEYFQDKELSPRVFNQRDEFIKTMIGSCIDGDGHASDIDGRVTFRSSSRIMLLQLKQLLFRLGVPNSWHFNNHPKQTDVNTRPYGQISFNYFDAKRVFSGYSHKVDNLNFVPKVKADSKVIVTEDYIYVPVSHIKIERNVTKTVYDANIFTDRSYVVNFVSVHNSNRNGDYFKEDDLKKYYPIFKNAGVFWNHDNKDPNKSCGKVLESFYNDKMHRIEIVIEVPTEKSRYLADYIKEGKPISVSMGLNTPSERCSICGHVTKGSYENRCEHLKFMMNTTLHDGRKVYAICGAPYKIFDISFVGRPADKTAYAMLTKSASTKELGLKSILQ